MKHPQLALSMVCCMGLGVLLAAELRHATEPRATTRPGPTAAVDAVSAPVVGALSPDAVSATAEIVDRPLFFASRRPLPPEPPQPVQAKQEPPPVLDFALVGTVVTARSQVALLKPDKAAWVQAEVGQSVGRWTVTSIDTDRIMVRSGAVEQMVGLRDFGSSHVLPAAMRAGINTGSAVGAATPASIAASAAATPPPPSSPIRRAGTRR